jgi:hypothetical protein
MNLSAVQHVRKMRGGSNSHLMRGSDGGYWIVKFLGNPQADRVLANEFLAGRLGVALGLPIPEVTPIEVSDWLVKNTPELCMEVYGREVPCRSGLHLASRYLADFDHDTLCESLPESFAHRIMNLEDFGRCLVLDRWTGNVDGRQAVFIRKSKYLGFKAYFIDQGHCFNAQEWNFPDRPLQGIYYRNYVYRHVTGWHDFEPTLSNAEQADMNDLWRVTKGLPQEWWNRNPVPDGMPKQWWNRLFPSDLSGLLESLHKRRSIIRQLITDFRESTRNPFPNWQDTPMVSVPAMPDEPHECRE